MTFHTHICHKSHIGGCLTDTACVVNERLKEAQVTSCDIPSRDDTNQALMVKPQLRMRVYKGWENKRKREIKKERGKVEIGTNFKIEELRRKPTS